MTATAAPDTASPTGPAERLLSLVTEVRSGEAGTALLLTANVLVLLTAYYVIKPVREALILELASGAEYKSYMSAAIAVALLALVPAYARFASRVARNRLVVGVTLFFVSHLVLFYLASLSPSIRAHLGLLFYLWVGVFNMMLVAQFWAFANDIYTEEQGKRLFPLVGIGATVGAAVGSKVTAYLAIPVGRHGLLLVSAGLLSLCAALFHWVHVRECRRSAESSRRGTSAGPSSPGTVGRQKSPQHGVGEEDSNAGRDSDIAERATEDDSGGSTGRCSEVGASDPSSTPRSTGAFSLVWRHRYLRLLAAFSFVFTVVNTNGEYLLSKVVKADALQRIAAGTLANSGLGDHLAATYGDFYFYVNLCTVALQVFVVSRLVKYGGLRVAFMVLPIVALFGGLAFLLLPVLAVLRVAKIAENSTDYSVNNTVRNMLWLPTTREMKYKAKQAVDTFFVRMGDVLSAAFVATSVALLNLDLRTFAAVNVALVAVWLLLARAILRENAKDDSRLGA